MVSASGFSTYTSLPAWHAMTVGRACQWSGVPTMTASMSLRSSTLRKSRVVSSAFWSNIFAMAAPVLVT